MCPQLEYTQIADDSVLIIRLHDKEIGQCTNDYFLFLFRTCDNVWSESSSQKRATDKQSSVHPIQNSSTVRCIQTTTRWLYFRQRVSQCLQQNGETMMMSTRTRTYANSLRLYHPKFSGMARVRACSHSAAVQIIDNRIYEFFLAIEINSTKSGLKFSSFLCVTVIAISQLSVIYISVLLCIHTQHMFFFLLLNFWMIWFAWRIHTLTRTSNWMEIKTKWKIEEK